ncbi:MAG: hypothetical protein ACI9VX_000795, partial [Dinoroseobacter sp.]
MRAYFVSANWPRSGALGSLPGRKRVGQELRNNPG